ncbi:phosphatidylinositol synthase 1 (CDP-alcohol phosphatidyltransferase1) [Saitoella coloradoensis]
MSSKQTPLRPNPKVNETPKDVFLFIPNLIGYSRVLLAGASLYYMPFHPKYCTWLYVVSCLLDAFDGMAARRFNQCTKFGAVLDMVTDRCTTSALLCFLSSEYPRFTILFQSLISLDLASHYMHMYSTLTTGGESHKKIPKEGNWVLRQYYGNNYVLFAFCACNELFFVALYLLSFPPRSPPRLGYLMGMPLSYPYVLAALTFPICAAKQIINCVQMANAARALVDVDLQDRKAAGVHANDKMMKDS